MSQLANPYAVTFAGLSDIGRKRAQNQDAFILPEDAAGGDCLFVLADGMGGHQGGASASRLAVKLVADFWDKREHSREALEQAIQAANELIAVVAQDDPTLTGMGTTLTALALHDGVFTYGHVGDSRLYRLRRNELGAGIQQLTRDHTVINRLIADGEITAHEAQDHPLQHMLDRCVGQGGDLEVESAAEEPLAAGDAFVLCCDGLHNLVAPEEVQRALQDAAPAEAARRLVALANDRGGHDNITVIVVHVDAAGAADPTS